MPPRARTHYLVALGQDPILLDPNRLYAIGRDPDCQITISDVQASRRHAELRHDLTSFTLIDLDSRNGTYINGRRVREKTLHNGDQFRIGSQTFQYIIQTDEDATELAQFSRQVSANETMAASALLQEQEDGGIMGSLAQFSLPELIQFLHSGHRTGYLEITTGTKQAKFWFNEGTLIDGEMGELGGEQALLDLAGETLGFFSFQPSAAAKLRKTTVTMATPTLLLEVCRVIDEKAK